MLKGIGLRVIFRNILLGVYNKIINIVNSFFIFSIKVMLKFFYYDLLTFSLRNSVNITLIGIPNVADLLQLQYFLVKCWNL